MALALVLGANGFIGSHVARALLEDPGNAVVGAGLGPPLPELTSRWLDLDLLADDDLLATELRAMEPSVVVNCTGATGGSAADLFRLNVLTTSALLASIGRSGVRTRLIQIGSAAEYGSGVTGEPVAETACPRPSSDYGIAKLAATQLVAAAAAAGRDAVVLRVFNAIGPGMSDGTLPGSALRRLTEAVASSAPRIEMGPLDSVRDFVDVRDIATAVMAAWHAPRLAPILNVGSGTGHTSRELVETLAALLGFRGEIGEAAEAASPRSSYVPWQVADVTLAAQLLGWHPIHDLESSVQRMVAKVG